MKTAGIVNVGNKSLPGDDSRILLEMCKENSSVQLVLYMHALVGLSC